LNTLYLEYKQIPSVSIIYIFTSSNSIEENRNFFSLKSEKKSQTKSISTSMQKKNAIVVLYKEDIPAALSLKNELKTAEIWVFEPHLLDRLSWAGIEDSKLVAYDLGLNMSIHVKEAAQQALDIEKKMDEVFEIDFNEAHNCHWQYQNLYLQLLSLNSYTSLWNNLLAKELDVQLHILMHDMPARFSAPSFWPTLLLIERLNSKGIEFKAYTYGSTEDTTQLIPAGRGLDALGQKNQPLVHLPTCFHDSIYFEEEILEAYPDALNFKSMNFQPLIWSVEFPNLKNVELCPAKESLEKLPVIEQSKINESTARVEDYLFNFYSGYTATTRYASRQAGYLAEQYRAQMIFYRCLESLQPKGIPEKIILSNHDGGMHGPFISYAKTYSIPIIFLPHSKVFNFPLACTHSNVIALTHPMQGEAISNVDGTRVKSHFLAFPEVFENTAKTASRFKNIGIILNDLSLGGYISANPEEYLSGVAEIYSWCSTNGIQCSIRTRPGASTFKWLLENTNFDGNELAKNSAGPISDFAKGCDICIMYDCPTSGAIEFLRQAIPIINTTFRQLCSTEAAISNVNTIPREKIKDTLRRLELYLSSPRIFFTFRSQQYAAYLERFSQSLPLRMYL
jgi:hypothetical protein